MTTDNTTTTNQQDINITISLSVAQWNTVLSILQKLPFAEPRGVLERFGAKTQDKKFEHLTDMCEVEMSVNDFNIILVCVKVMPFYDSFDIVNAIMTQGTEQMAKQSEAVALESQKAEAEKPKKKTTRRKKATAE